MNGAHDLGGMEGFGPVRAEPESEEPVFHAEWEGRVLGLNRSLGLLGQWNIDIGRHANERQHPADYLRHTYYENWLAGMQTLLLEKGLVTAEELRTGKASSPVPQQIRDRALTIDKFGKVPLRKTDYLRDIDAPPRFEQGDRVRAINRHPSGHTREPRYVRGHVGVIRDHYGAQVFPDLSAHGVDEGRHLYSVRFDGAELWGESANPRSAVYLDMWEDYLEPA
jgi:nitrile hydratase